jgi:hypothetical protein
MGRKNGRDLVLSGKPRLSPTSSNIIVVWRP